MTRYIHHRTADTIVMSDGSIWLTSPYLTTIRHTTGELGNVRVAIASAGERVHYVDLVGRTSPAAIPPDTLALVLRHLASGDVKVFLSPQYPLRDIVLRELRAGPPDFADAILRANQLEETWTKKHATT